MGARKAQEYLRNLGYKHEMEFTINYPVDNYLNGPECCIVDEFGNLIICDFTNNRIVIRDADTLQFLSKWNFLPLYPYVGGVSALSGPTGACILNGKLYIVCYLTDYINVYNIVYTNERITSIVYSTRFGGNGTSNGKFSRPWAICTDGTYLFVTENTGGRVQQFLATDNSYVGKSTVAGAFGICYHGGNIYICSYSAGVVVLSAADLSAVDSFTANVANPRACHVDANYLYVSSGNGTSTAKLQRFILSTKAVDATYGSFGTGDTQFKKPQSLAYWDGNFFVADETMNQVKVHQASDFAYVRKSGTTGSTTLIGATIFKPLINFPTGYSPTMIFDDGAEFPLISDTDIHSISQYGWTPKTSGDHTMRIDSIPESAVKIITSNNAPLTNAWALYQPTPVMSFGRFAYVWFDGTTYHCYYDYDSSTKFGHATSSDGVTWTNDTANNPVLSIGPETYDNATLCVPNVWKEDSAWYMLYRGNDVRMCLATSEDGLVWTKYAGNPVNTMQCDPAGLIKVGSTYYLYGNSAGGANKCVDVFTSTNLHSWTHQLPTLFAGNRYCSCPFKYSGKYYLLVSQYAGPNNAGSYMELFEDTSPTFASGDFRYCGVVLFFPTTTVIDTPTIVTDTIYRDSFPGNKLMCYFSMAEPTEYMYLTVQDDIAAAILAAVNPRTGNTLR
jgi:hypothetical protein